MLQRFEIGERTYGFAEGSLGYIVSEIDFCYRVRSLRENIEVQSNYAFDALREFSVLTVDEIRALAHPITSWSEWAHYWGIKGRIGRNYKDMLEHMERIGADITGMPQWGSEPNAEVPVSASALSTTRDFKK